MDPKATTLSSLIGSRICHDLISPIGAINNGLELLGMAGTTSGPELSLIGDSVENATARIKFFRIAFGLAGDEAIAAAEARSILADLQNGGRVRIDWQVSQALPRQEVRLAFLGLMCLETAMAYGGDIVLRNDAGTWHLTGSAPRLQVDAPLWTDLTAATQSIAMQPATVQFALLREGVEVAGRTLNVHTSETNVSISF